MLMEKGSMKTKEEIGITIYNPVCPVFSPFFNAFGILDEIERGRGLKKMDERFPS